MIRAVVKKNKRYTELQINDGVAIKLRRSLLEYLYCFKDKWYHIDLTKEGEQRFYTEEWAKFCF